MGLFSKPRDVGRDSMNQGIPVERSNDISPREGQALPAALPADLLLAAQLVEPG